MNNAVPGKPMENERNDKDIKLITTEARRNFLVLDPSYDLTKKHFRQIISNRNEKNIDTQK